MQRDHLHASLGLLRDQRGAERHVLRLTALGGPSGSAIAVRDLSRTGMLIVSDGVLTTGEVIMVELPDGANHVARIVWTTKGLAGCRFGQPLSRASLSAALLRAPPLRSAPSSGPDTAAREALTLRAKAVIIVSAALLCWACLAGAVYLIAW